MSTTISANVLLSMSVVETFTDGFVGSDNTISFAAPQVARALNASSTPAGTKATGYEVNLSSGALTLDLTNLTAIGGGAFTGTGLKIQGMFLGNKSTNANTMLFASGASNGYQTDAATNFSMPLAPGQSLYLDLDDAGQTVGSSHKTIDVSGTGAQTLQIFFIFG